MAEDLEHGEAGGSPFGGVDAKLTIYALANGVDLVKGEGFRRRETSWRSWGPCSKAPRRWRTPYSVG